MQCSSFFVSLLIASSALTFARAEDADPMEKFYANTLISKHDDGGLYYVYFNKDRTYRVLHDGKEIKAGTYTYDAGKLCMVDKDKSVECPPFRADLKVGETWDAVTPKGHDRLTLSAGRQP